GDVRNDLRRSGYAGESFDSRKRPAVGPDAQPEDVRPRAEMRRAALRLRRWEEVGQPVCIMPARGNHNRVRVDNRRSGFIQKRAGYSGRLRAWVGESHAGDKTRRVVERQEQISAAGRTERHGSLGIALSRRLQSEDGV